METYIEYSIYDINDSLVSYKRYVNDKHTIIAGIEEFSVVYQCVYREKNKVEHNIIYIDQTRIAENEIYHKLWPEEMANGHIMLSYLDETINENQTMELIKERYGARIDHMEVDLNALMFDDFICCFQVDGISFCISCDFGIVTISPEDEKGDGYIKEITDYLNRYLAEHRLEG